MYLFRRWQVAISDPVWNKIVLMDTETFPKIDFQKIFGKTVNQRWNQLCFHSNIVD